MPARASKKAKRTAKSTFALWKVDLSKARQCLQYPWDNATTAAVSVQSLKLRFWVVINISLLGGDYIISLSSF